MIKFSYQKGWDRELIIERRNPISSQFKKIIDYNAHELDTYVSDVASSVLEKIIVGYDADDCLYGLFRASAGKRINPFLATHNYCLLIERLEVNHQTDRFAINVSPIYHLGPEYPNEYKREYGKDLATEAIVGLIEMPVENQTRFALGVDAGLAFGDKSKMAHNKKMSLELVRSANGLMATLKLADQATAKQFTWETLGLRPVESASAGMIGNGF